jgi:hypothetical protein
MPTKRICPTCTIFFAPHYHRQIRCSRRCAAVARTVPFITRFWAMVDTQTCLGDTCGCHRGLGHCWPWIGSRTPLGYGWIAIPGNKSAQTHRAIYTYEQRLMLPKTIGVLHRCDNPSCCRMNHLFHGTQLDNIRDCAQKGRLHSGTGPRHWKYRIRDAHLTTLDILAIRALRGHQTQQALADIYSLYPSRVSRIQRSLAWTEVEGTMSVDEAMKHLSLISSQR